MLPVGQRRNLLVPADRSRYEFGLKLPNLGIGNGALITQNPMHTAIPKVEVHVIERGDVTP